MSTSTRHRCDDCGRVVVDDHPSVKDLSEIKGLGERLDPGGTIPSGECTACGALIYPVEEPAPDLLS